MAGGNDDGASEATKRKTRKRAPLIERAGMPPLEVTPHNLTPRLGEFESKTPAFFRTVSMVVEGRGEVATGTDGAAAEDPPERSAAQAVASAASDAASAASKAAGSAKQLSAAVVGATSQVRADALDKDVAELEQKAADLADIARKSAGQPPAISKPLSLTELDQLGTGYQESVRGVVHTHKQTWKVKGLALGNVLHSLALAPGEATMISMQDWSHDLRGTDREEAGQVDRASRGDSQNRALSEVQDATARELQTGSTSARSFSQSAQAGVALGVFSASSAENAAASLVVNKFQGEKAAAAHQNQRVHQSTQQHAEAARTRRATVVREIRESDSSNNMTRVVANYNHMHALTVMYYEVLEVYEVETSTAARQTCLFVPFEFKSVDALIQSHGRVLAKAAEARGDSDLATAIMLLKGYDVLGHRAKSISDTLAEVVNNVAVLIKRTNDQQERLAGQPGAKLSSDNLSVLSEIQSGLTSVSTAFQTARDKAEPTPTRSEEDPTPQGEGPEATMDALLAAIKAVAEGIKAPADQLAGLYGTFDYQANPTQNPATGGPPFAGGTESGYGVACLNTLAIAVSALKGLEAEIAQTAGTASRVKADSASSWLETREELVEAWEYFNQAVLLATLTPTAVRSLLANKSWGGKNLGDIVDPTPLAFTANLVAFAIDDPEAPEEPEVVTSEVVVPTGGVFAEAVLGEALSAERIDLVRFWNWQDSPIPLKPPRMSPISSAHSVSTMDLSPGDLAPSAAELRELPVLPPPSSIDAILGTLKSRDLFKNDASAETAGAILKVAVEAARAQAMDAAQHAENQQKRIIEAGEKAAAAIGTDGMATLFGGTKSLDGEGAAKAEEKEEAGEEQEEETPTSADGDDSEETPTEEPKEEEKEQQA